VSDCIEKALPDSGVLPVCVVGAQSCAEMNVCTGTGYYQDACPLGQQNQVTCVGSKVVACTQILRTFSDCTKIGANCVRYDSGNDGGVDSAGCAVTPTCSVPTDSYACSGTKRVRCSHGVGLGEDCAARGMQCRDAPGGAMCALTPPSCAQPGVGSCDAQGKGTYCDADGRQFAFDCARLGLTCKWPPGKPTASVAPTPRARPLTPPIASKSATEPMAHLCIGGQRFSIDCGTYGFRGCALETKASVGGRARCVDPANN